MAGETLKTLELLLNCQICTDPFDQTLRIPRILPCHHTFCGPCITMMNSCPNDRTMLEIPRNFPVDITRAALVELREVLLEKGGASSPLKEACQKHQDEKLKFFCTTCKSALCSECAFIEHKNKVGHDIVRLVDVLEQVKGEIQELSNDLQHIQESSLQPRAKLAATSLQETEASFKAAEQDIEDVFSKAVKVLLDRKTQALEELESKWKRDEYKLHQQASLAEFLVSKAKNHTAMGRTVSSKGLPSDVVAQRQELESTVQEARAEGGKPVLPSRRYRVHTSLMGLKNHLGHLGTLHSEDAQAPEKTRPEQRRKGQTREMTLTQPTFLLALKEQRRLRDSLQSAVTSLGQPAVTSLRQPAPTSSAVTSRRQPAPTSSGVMSRRQPAPTAPEVTSSPIQTPEFELAPGQCNVGCSLKEDGKTLANYPRLQSGGTGLSGPRSFAFLGTCGSVDLAQPALHYWTVRFWVWSSVSEERCEFGLASLQSLQTCGSGNRISDHDHQAPTILAVIERTSYRLEGRGWTLDVDTPPPPVTSDTPYTCLGRRPRDRLGIYSTLGFLYDNRQPQSPRVLVVETQSCRLLGVRHLSPSPDLRPVVRFGPSSNADTWTGMLQVGTGPGVLDDVTASRLQSLLRQMER